MQYLYNFVFNYYYYYFIYFIYYFYIFIIIIIYLIINFVFKYVWLQDIDIRYKMMFFRKKRNF